MKNVLTCPCDGEQDEERFSVYAMSKKEAEEYKWLESEKVGYDLGEACLRKWVREHWWGFLRARWIEHLQGRRFWMELDRGDFGLLLHEFHCDALLLDRILDQIKAGAENLDIILWADVWHIPRQPVLDILEQLDINGHRLVHQFDPI